MSRSEIDGPTSGGSEDKPTSVVMYMCMNCDVHDQIGLSPYYRFVLSGALWGWSRT